MKENVPGTYEDAHAALTRALPANLPAVARQLGRLEALKAATDYYGPVLPTYVPRWDAGDRWFRAYLVTPRALECYALDKATGIGHRYIAEGFGEDGGYWTEGPVVQWTGALLTGAGVFFDREEEDVIQAQLSAHFWDEGRNAFAGWGVA